MKKVEQTYWISLDNRTHYSESACLEHEERIKEQNKRMNNLITWPDTELELLIQNLKEAKELAFCTGIIDTMGNPQCRAVYYMKNVCQTFVDKHKELRMI